MPDLVACGWTDARAKEFDAVPGAGLVPGRVCLEHNHMFRVLTWDAECVAQTAGRMKHQAEGRVDLPAVGDWVALRPDPAGGLALITAVLPRRSAFSRKAAGRDAVQQIVAANIDTVLLVFGLDRPINRRAIERYVLATHRGRARPVVVLNKTDVCARPDRAIAVASASAGGAPVHAVCAVSGEGIDQLEPYLSRGQTVALLGPSGVGKSSVVNRLVGRDVLSTGGVREWDSRGRHTSVHRHLIVLERGGTVIDTPGMRELQLWDSDVSLAESFSDISSLAASCRFRDCRHDQEPGCAVKVAVTEGRVAVDRFASFLKLRGEEADLARRREERGR